MPDVACSADSACRLALQFTALVFGLMLVLGAVFIAIEFTDVNRQLDNRLQRQAAAINKKIVLPITVEEARWLHGEAFNVKIATGRGGCCTPATSSLACPSVSTPRR